MGRLLCQAAFLMIAILTSGQASGTGRTGVSIFGTTVGPGFNRESGYREYFTTLGLISDILFPSKKENSMVKEFEMPEVM